jgi:hypothetical protein
MSSRDLALTCLERLMAVERYYESQRPVSTPPQPAPLLPVALPPASSGADARTARPDRRDEDHVPGTQRAFVGPSRPA